MAKTVGQLSGMNQVTVPWSAEDAPVPGAGGRPEFPAQEADIAAFREDGVVLVKGAFAEWVEPLRRGLERNLSDPKAYAFPCESTPQGEAGRFFDSYCNWTRIPEYRDYVLSSAAASMAGRFMGASRAQFFHEHAFVKEPGTQRATPWHHDLPYYCVDGHQNVSLYVSLDSVPEGVGLRFVAGSHRWDKLFYPRVFLDGADFNIEDSGLAPVPDIAARPGDYDLRVWPLEPGDTILFDFRTLHGTNDGLIGARRRAFSTRWLGDDMRFCERPGETSPPYPDIGLKPGEALREDWFPVLWPAGPTA